MVFKIHICSMHVSFGNLMNLCQASGGERINRMNAVQMSFFFENFNPEKW